MLKRIGLLLTVLLGPQMVYAQAADPILQTDLFALYCLGVFDEGARRRASLPNLCDSTTPADLCAQHKSRLQRIEADDSYRRGRFERYLRARAALTAERAQFISATSGALRQQGGADLALCLDTIANDFVATRGQCDHSCGKDATAADCNACFEKFSPRPAVCKSIDRCSDPALLPF